MTRNNPFLGLSFRVKNIVRIRPPHTNIPIEVLDFYTYFLIEDIKVGVSIHLISIHWEQNPPCPKLDKSPDWPSITKRRQPLEPSITQPVIFYFSSINRQIWKGHHNCLLLGEVRSEYDDVVIIYYFLHVKLINGEFAESALGGVMANMFGLISHVHIHFNFTSAFCLWWVSNTNLLSLSYLSRIIRMRIQIQIQILDTNIEYEYNKIDMLVLPSEFQNMESK